MTIPAPSTEFPVNTTSYKIDPSHSLVEFSVQYMGIFNLVGHFNLNDATYMPPRSYIDGLILIDENDWLKSSVSVRFESAAIETGDTIRDEALRSKHFLDCAGHRAISFASTRVEMGPDDRYQVYGDLTIRGEARRVVLDTVFAGKGPGQNGAERAAFSASTTISRRDFGLTLDLLEGPANALVNDEIEITLELECTRFARTMQTQQELDALAAVRAAEMDLEAANQQLDFDALRGIISEELVYFGGNGASQTRDDWFESLRASKAASAVLAAERVRERAAAQERGTVLLMTGLRVGEVTESELEYHGDVVITNGVYSLQDPVPGKPLEAGSERCLRHVRMWKLVGGAWRLISHRYIHALD